MECEICRANKKLHRHHLSYKPEVIQILCPSCHRKVHWKMNRNRRIRPSKKRDTDWFFMDKEKMNKIITLKNLGYSDWEIAYELGCCQMTVLRWRRKLGISGLKSWSTIPSEPKREKVTLFKYRDGMLSLILNL